MQFTGDIVTGWVRGMIILGFLGLLDSFFIRQTRGGAGEGDRGGDD